VNRFAIAFDCARVLALTI